MCQTTFEISITAIILIDHYQVNWVGKSLFFWKAKSWDCFLTHWLPMKSILSLIDRDNLTIPIQIQLHQKHKNVSLFFLAFLKYSWNFEHFGEKDYAHRFVFPKLRTTNAWSDKRLKSLVSDNHWTSNTGNVPNQCWNLHHIILIIFTHHFQVNLVGKSLCFWDTKSWDCLLTHWLPMKRILFLIETI